MRLFFDNRFVKLFVFDGELADKLLDSSESVASQAIDTLFQLYLLESIKVQAENLWKIRTKDKTAKGERGLTRRKNKVTDLEQRIQNVTDKRDEAVEELFKLQPDIDKLEKKIDEQTSTQKDLYEELEAKKREKLNTHNQVENLAAEVMTQIRKPHLLHDAFAKSLVELKDQLDRLRLPASTSSQFFTELLEEKECICGRPLDIHACQVISQRRELYLAEDTSGILNALKQDIDMKVRQEGNETAADLADKLDQLGEAVQDHRLAETVVRHLEQQLIDQGNDELKAWAQERDKKVARKQELDKLLLTIDGSPKPNDNERTQCLTSLKKQLAEAQKDLAEITGTLELRTKINVLQNEILDVAIRKARTNLQIVIANDCNRRLEKVLSRDPIRIDKIDRSLKLLNQEGASVGQTLSVSYIFLTTLLNRGQHQFPLIVDSPAGSLSIEVRREIAKLIPNLCNQFVAFTISSEREGFTNEIYSISSQTKFLTLFRYTESTEELVRSLPSSGVLTKTLNAVLIEGKDYFDKFDLEEVKD